MLYKNKKDWLSIARIAIVMSLISIFITYEMGKGMVQSIIFLCNFNSRQDNLLLSIFFVGFFSLLSMLFLYCSFGMMKASLKLFIKANALKPS